MLGDLSMIGGIKIGGFWFFDFTCHLVSTETGFSSWDQFGIWSAYVVCSRLRGLRTWDDDVLLRVMNFIAPTLWNAMLASNENTCIPICIVVYKLNKCFIVVLKWPFQHWEKKLSDSTLLHHTSHTAHTCAACKSVFANHIFCTDKHQEQEEMMRNIWPADSISCTIAMHFCQFAWRFCFKISVISVVRFFGTVFFSIGLRDEGRGYISQLLTISLVSADTSLEAATVMHLFQNCCCEVYPCTT